ncbi:unnamed protein product, partial [Discosporangium mesarthrocarpum]
MLMEGGASASRPLSRGLTPLMTAAGHPSGPATALELTRVLLDAGADVAYCGPQGSALHAAASAGYADVVAALLEVGSDANATDESGCTPLDVCTEEAAMAVLTQHLEERSSSGVVEGDDRDGGE